MSNKQKAIDRSNQMVNIIARDIKMGRTEIGYRHIKQKYKVGTQVAKKARLLADVKESPNKALANYAKGKPGRKPKPPSVDMMYRPNGINPLTIAWV